MNNKTIYQQHKIKIFNKNYSNKRNKNIKNKKKKITQNSKFKMKKT